MCACYFVFTLLSNDSITLCNILGRGECCTSIGYSVLTCIFKYVTALNGMFFCLVQWSAGLALIYMSGVILLGRSHLNFGGLQNFPSGKSYASKRFIIPCYLIGGWHLQLMMHKKQLRRLWFE